MAPLFGLGRGNIPDGLQQAVVIEPLHPFERGPFDGFPALPRRAAMDQLDLVEATDRLGQAVVVGIADTADRRLDAGFGQPFRVADGNVLRAAITMMDQPCGRRA